jgi:hypothetical protein
VFGLPAILFAARSLFHFRIFPRKDLNGATVLTCTHFQMGQFDIVLAAHFLPPGLKASLSLKP